MTLLVINKFLFYKLISKLITVTNNFLSLKLIINKIFDRDVSRNINKKISK